MTEAGLGRLDVDTFEDETCCIRPAEVVELDPLDPGFLLARFPDPVQPVRVVEVFPVRADEEERVGVLVVSPHSASRPRKTSLDRNANYATFVSGANRSASARNCPIAFAAGWAISLRAYGELSGTGIRRSVCALSLIVRIPPQSPGSFTHRKLTQPALSIIFAEWISVNEPGSLRRWRSRCGWRWWTI